MEIVQTKTQTLNTMKEEIQSIPPRLRKQQTNEFWKDKDNFSRQRWYSTLAGFEGLMAQAIQEPAFTLFHTEFEALSWTQSV